MKHYKFYDEDGNSYELGPGDEIDVSGVGKCWVIEVINDSTIKVRDSRSKILTIKLL